MSLKVISTILAAAVADAGTFNVNYPAGTSKGDFLNGVSHAIVINQVELKAPNKVTFTFNAANITVTNKSGAAWAEGSQAYIQLDAPGKDGPVLTDQGKAAADTTEIKTTRISLGNPITADPDGIALLQTTAGAADFALAGAQVVDGVAILDVPRNVTLTGATTDHSAATITVTGEDVYGNVMVETMAGTNGNTVAGKKAFKKVTKVHTDTAIATNGISVGFGDVLGLPVFLPGAGYVVKELENGAAATAGTLVAGDVAKATATTGDVRGTYDPNSACDGAKVFVLFAELPDPEYTGADQFAG